MNALKFKRNVYLISATVLLTVAIQIHRNAQIYLLNKQHFTTDVQEAFDLGVETYFANMLRDAHTFWVYNHHHRGCSQCHNHVHSPLDTTFTKDENTLWHNDQYGHAHGHDLKVSLAQEGSSWAELKHFIHLLNAGLEEGFPAPIMKLLAEGAFDIAELSSLIKKELKRRRIDVKFVLIDFALVDEYDHVLPDVKPDMDYALSLASKSQYLPPCRQLSIHFENTTLQILKRGAVDLLISLLVCTAVIGSLIYLYRVISRQKQLAEIKNDLISNITHEFKTPIATISTAIEAISNFNEAKDPAKTAKYLGISSHQLKKLHDMVEKILETASLDSEALEMKVEQTELTAFTRQVFEKFRLLPGEKKLSFQAGSAEIWREIDRFHIENVLSNLIDNALKYGGDEITLSLARQGENVLWEVKDNGGKITRQQQQLIFDKFYRIPTGNVHNVKGFGIGLYYAKKIVEKHGGQMSLEVSNHTTTFRIRL